MKWIIRKQGAFFDTMTIVTWESDQLSMPKWNMDTESIITEYENEQEENDWDSWDDDWSEKRRYRMVIQLQQKNFIKH